MCSRRRSLGRAPQPRIVCLGLRQSKHIRSPPLRDMRAEGGAAEEDVAADAGEAVGQAGQREGGAAAEGAVADAGEAVG
eukprot:scaffold27271_cov47-Phaeocystis_antarctica.AAC.3